MEDKELEVWKDIETPSGQYQISNYGRCRKLFYREVTKSRNGYMIVRCSDNNISFCINVAHAVAKAFCKKNKNETIVNHKDSNIQNNYYKNLEWSTQRENVSHSFIKSRNSKNKYTGVYLGKDKKKYSVQISVKGKRYNIGSHENEEVAAIVYLSALSVIGERNRYFKVRGVVLEEKNNITPEFIIELIKRQNPALKINQAYIKKIFTLFIEKLKKNDKI